MKTAIIGLPQVGKTSLFKILTGVSADSRIGTTKVQLGIANVPDRRLEALASLFGPERVKPATVEYADMPGLSREALREASYIGSLRMVDAFAHVLRMFEDDTIMHIDGSVDPVRDWANIDLELILNDLQVVENRLERVDKDMKRIKDSGLASERALLRGLPRLAGTRTPLAGIRFHPCSSKAGQGIPIPIREADAASAQRRRRAR